MINSKFVRFELCWIGLNWVELYSIWLSWLELRWFFTPIFYCTNLLVRVKLGNTPTFAALGCVEGPWKFLVVGGVVGVGNTHTQYHSSLSWIELRVDQKTKKTLDTFFSQIDSSYDFTCDEIISIENIHRSNWMLWNKFVLFLIFQFPCKRNLMNNMSCIYTKL